MYFVKSIEWHETWSSNNHVFQFSIKFFCLCLGILVFTSQLRFWLVHSASAHFFVNLIFATSGQFWNFSEFLLFDTVPPRRVVFTSCWNRPVKILASFVSFTLGFAFIKSIIWVFSRLHSISVLFWFGNNWLHFFSFQLTCKKCKTTEK